MPSVMDACGWSGSVPGISLRRYWYVEHSEDINRLRSHPVYITRYTVVYFCYMRLIRVVTDLFDLSVNLARNVNRVRLAVQATKPPYNTVQALTRAHFDSFCVGDISFTSIFPPGLRRYGYPGRPCVRTSTGSVAAQGKHCLKFGNGCSGLHAAYRLMIAMSGDMGHCCLARQLAREPRMDHPNGRVQHYQFTVQMLR